MVAEARNVRRACKLRGLDETTLVELAGRFAPRLAPPLVIYLEGDLGAGKTTFVRALIRALGYDGAVKSPTYGLMELYELPKHAGETPIRVVHLDLYRIADPAEVDYLGLADLLDDRTVLCVEWPGQGAGALPPADLVLTLEESAPGEAPSREMQLYAYSDSGIKLCEFIDPTL